MARQRKQVTLRWLRRMERDCYCPESVAAFIKKWGKGGRPTVEKCVKACWERGERGWPNWLLKAVLPKGLRSQYRADNLGRRSQYRADNLKVRRSPEKKRRAAWRRLDYTYAKRLMEL